MRFIAAISAAVAICLAAGPAWAQLTVWGEQQPSMADKPVPSWLGLTGLVNIPSAATRSPQTAAVHAHWMDTNWAIDSDVRDFWTYGVEVSPTRGVELSVTRLDNIRIGIPPYTAAGGAYFDDITCLNAKWELGLSRWLGNEALPKLAVGVRDATNEYNRAYFLALTHTAPLSNGRSRTRGTVALTLGYGDNELNFGVLDGLFAGLEFTIGDYWRVQLEYDAEDFNADARWFIGSRLTLDVGTIDGELGVGATYASGW